METQKRCTFRRAAKAVGTGSAVLLVTVACSSSHKPSSTTTSSSTSSAGAVTSSSSSSSSTSGGNTVQVQNFAFSPKTLTVPVGTKVTWKFDDSTAHTVKASNGAFTSTAFADGQTYSFTFNTAGTYNYICSIHPFMTGSVVVQ
jgi:plastocyanin